MRDSSAVPRRSRRELPARLGKNIALGARLHDQHVERNRVAARGDVDGRAAGPPAAPQQHLGAGRARDRGHARRTRAGDRPTRRGRRRAGARRRTLRAGRGAVRRPRAADRPAARASRRGGRDPRRVTRASGTIANRASFVRRDTTPTVGAPLGRDAVRAGRVVFLRESPSAHRRRVPARVCESQVAWVIVVGAETSGRSLGRLRSFTHLRPAGRTDLDEPVEPCELKGLQGGSVRAGSRRSRSHLAASAPLPQEDAQTAGVQKRHPAQVHDQAAGAASAQSSPKRLSSAASAARSSSPASRAKTVSPSRDPPAGLSTSRTVCGRPKIGQRSCIRRTGRRPRGEPGGTSSRCISPVEAYWK